MSDLNTALNPIATQFEAQMRGVAEDSDYSEDYKAREIESLRTAGLAQLETARAAYFEKIEAEKQGLIGKACIATPSPELAIQLSYAKDALLSRWQTMTPAEIIADFAAAIEAKDTPAVRIYLDFGAAAMVENLKARSGQLDAPVPFEFRELLSRGEGVLMDKKQVAAKKRLAEIQAELDRRNRRLDPAAVALLKSLVYRAGQLEDKRISALQRATGF